ncbi:hypothetical protein AB1Y20_017190 [Prymnesium parvum]|uniref:Uncharacterized protein n=1 Tax=Prymnesium parvum TaxID=97485 RepID=A0AB34IC02_PRYPA
MAYSVEELEVEIAKVTQSVSKVEEEIHALQPQIEEAARKALERGVDQRYWRKTEELLLKEEELLLKQESLHIVRGEKLKGFLLAQLAGGSLQWPSLGPDIVARLGCGG